MLDVSRLRLPFGCTKEKKGMQVKVSPPKERDKRVCVRERDRDRDKLL